MPWLGDPEQLIAEIRLKDGKGDSIGVSSNYDPYHSHNPSSFPNSVGMLKE
jgi:hypothetical protein